ncbi:hypothetical protein V6N11_043131 [Hibiscus sabdariffa]|uniref:Uncharacterized protein n=1 Tax=Hibiscus sabdariffa TaxID=183260 RepID=A0ABR2QYM4_9ROSI
MLLALLPWKARYKERVTQPRELTQSGRLPLMRYLGIVPDNLKGQRAANKDLSDALCLAGGFFPWNRYLAYNNRDNDKNGT